MKRLCISLVVVIYFCSCAKISYVVEQGIGQLKIQNRGRPNSIVLSDPTVPRDYKEKIKFIIKCKKFFYSFFAERASGIYSKTTILDQEAVSYLVIRSRFDEIKAVEECFPIVGCFPYLGFFEENSAKRFISSLDSNLYVSWKRPVYAYSTLGHFEDRILSSFFYFDNFDLSEIVFHELFHTIFFVKDEVDFNENLANYFGKEMAFLYHQMEDQEKTSREQKVLKERILRNSMVPLIKSLKNDFESNKPKTIKESRERLNLFIKNSFRPHIKKKCQTLGIKKCPYLAKEWNNASLAAFMTYQKEIEDIKLLHNSLKLNLFEFYKYIVSEYSHYKKQKVGNITFSKYLFK